MTEQHRFDLSVSDFHGDGAYELRRDYADDGLYVLASDYETIKQRLAAAESKISEWEAAPDFVKAGDGTLHGAIDHWQNKAIEYKDKYLASLEERVNLQQHIQSALDLIEIEGLDEEGRLRIGPDNTEKLIKLLRGE